MGKQGCSFNGGTCYPVIESCQGSGKTAPAISPPTSSLEPRKW
jgi:hypothetical protein